MSPRIFYNAAMNRIHTILASLMLMACAGCSHNNAAQEETLAVSISPIKYIVETITCGDFNVEVLVPDGASPETFSPSASQMAGIEKSRMLFTSGLLDFEQELVKRISNNTTQIIDLSKGIEVLSGTCSHVHNGDGHSHGTDPHIWTSPKQLKIMVANAHDAIMQAFPDSVKYDSAYMRLCSRLDAVSDTITNRITASGTDAFIIYHPALTYYAADYGLEQISLEEEGKEPSAAHMGSIIRLAGERHINKLLYQRQFPVEVVMSAAKDMNAEPVEIDPLGENIVDEILRITDIITEQ